MSLLSSIKSVASKVSSAVSAAAPPTIKAPTSQTAARAQFVESNYPKTTVALKTAAVAVPATAALVAFPGAASAIVAGAGKVATYALENPYKAVAAPIAGATTYGVLKTVGEGSVTRGAVETLKAAEKGGESIAGFVKEHPTAAGAIAGVTGGVLLGELAHSLLGSEGGEPSEVGKAPLSSPVPLTSQTQVVEAGSKSVSKRRKAKKATQVPSVRVYNRNINIQAVRSR